MTDNVTDKFEDILNCIRAKPDITLVEIGKELNVSRKVVTEKIRALKEMGKIKRVGSDRKGHWEILP